MLSVMTEPVPNVSASTVERDRGWLLLGGERSLTVADGDLGPLLDRLGLEPGTMVAAGDAAATGMAVQFGGVAFDLHGAGRAPEIARMLLASPCRAVGLVEVPDAAQVPLAISIRGPVDVRAGALQRLCAVAAMLAPAVGASAMFWSPARLWTSAHALAEAVSAMEAEGLPPILHLVDFDMVATPAGQVMRTRGLTWIVGHELRLSCPDSFSHSDGLRRLARLAIAALQPAALMPQQTIPGLLRGERLVIGAMDRDVHGAWLPVAVERTGR